MIEKNNGLQSFRLLTEYRSFLLWRLWILLKNHITVSVSLRSIVHSYVDERLYEDSEVNKKSFRLLTEYRSFLFHEMYFIQCCRVRGFPSPYGVSFILILYRHIMMVVDHISFRLLTEYRSFLSFSNNTSFEILNWLGFRLLTEYRSFLSKVFRKPYSIHYSSFRLLTEYRSFLFCWSNS